MINNGKTYLRLVFKELTSIFVEKHATKSFLILKDILLKKKRSSLSHQMIILWENLKTMQLKIV
jgi:hypothetical protein